MPAAGNDRGTRDLPALSELQDALIDPGTQPEIIGVDDDLCPWIVIVDQDSFTIRPWDDPSRNYAIIFRAL